MGRLAIIAGSGQLPVHLAQAAPDALRVGFDGIDTEVALHHRFRFEHLGGMFDRLKAEGVSRLVMGGGMSRPALDPTLFDAGMAEIAPRLLRAMAGGDDGLLREIIAIFEGQGLRVVGAHEILPDLTARSGLLAGPDPSDAQLADLRRADAILGALSPVDVGQAVVVEGGLCFGVETIQGTDALLGFVAQTPAHLRRGAGVLVKRPKVGQDLRVDMPSVGVTTLDHLQRAGLAGLVISPGTVLLIDSETLLTEADKRGLFILARRPE